MTQRTLVKGAEEALGTNAGAAKTFSGATVVRLVNTATGEDHLVTLASAVSGSTVSYNTFTGAHEGQWETDISDPPEGTLISTIDGMLLIK